MDDGDDESICAFCVDGVGVFSALILDEEAALHILANIQPTLINFLIKIATDASNATFVFSNTFRFQIFLKCFTV